MLNHFGLNFRIENIDLKDELVNYQIFRVMDLCFKVPKENEIYFPQKVLVSDKVNEKIIAINFLNNED